MQPTTEIGNQHTGSGACSQVGGRLGHGGLPSYPGRGRDLRGLLPAHGWRARLTGLPPGTLFAFRCWGPNWDYQEGWTRGNSAVSFVQDVYATGNRFNPNKVLFAPYAREISHDKETLAMSQADHHGGMYATGGGNYR